MKKILALCILIGISGLVYAQTGTWVTKTVDVKLDATAINTASANLTNTDVSFCESWAAKTMAYNVKPGKVLPICIYITNDGDSEARIEIWFVDGVITNDQWKNKACDQSKMTNFGQYMTGYESPIVLPAHTSIQKRISFLWPKTQTGVIHGCIAYHLGNIPVQEDTANFNIQIRKVKFVDIFPILPSYTIVIVWWSIVIVLLIILMLVRIMRKYTHKA